jgi:hypothetical protein
MTQHEDDRDQYARIVLALRWQIDSNACYLTRPPAGLLHLDPSPRVC